MKQVQFGSTLFPHNPRKITVEFRRQSASYALPFAGEQLVVTGDRARVAVLEGELFADTPQQAAAQYQLLQDLYQNQRRGLLFLPGSGPFYAVFEQLELLGVGDGRVYSYVARFVEDPGFGGEAGV